MDSFLLKIWQRRHKHVSVLKYQLVTWLITWLLLQMQIRALFANNFQPFSVVEKTGFSGDAMQNSLHPKKIICSYHKDIKTKQLKGWTTQNPLLHNLNILNKTRSYNIFPELLSKHNIDWQYHIKTNCDLKIKYSIESVSL